MSTCPKNKTKSNVIYCAVIFLVTFGIYWNSLQGDFIWDDRGLILENTSYLESWKNVFSSFTQPFFGTTPFYRPLLLVSFILDYQLWGLNPFGFHFSNVLLHGLNGFMVYLLAFLLFKQRTFALSAGLLFATHPIQTEAVAWISGRNDVLLTFFSLLTIICWIQWRKLEGTKGVFAYVGFLLSYCCVLLTKESGIILPVLIMLVDYFSLNTFPHRLHARQKVYLPLILISVLYISVRMNLLGGADLQVRELDTRQIVSGVMVTYAYYVKMLLFPIVQTASPSILTVSSFKNPEFITSIVLVGSLAVVTVSCWKRFRELSFIVLWFFVALLPVSGIISLPVPALEHRLYLGSVAFSMLIPLLFYRTLLPRTHESFARSSPVFSLCILVALIMFYSTKTVTRNTVWKDERTFWLHTVQYSPSSVFAHNNLGIVYAREGQHNKAIRIFKKALSLPRNQDPSRRAFANGTRWNVYNNLGKSYYAMLEKQLNAEGKRKEATVNGEGMFIEQP
jgi:hypothetical protein